MNVLALGSMLNVYPDSQHTSYSFLVLLFLLSIFAKFQFFVLYFHLCVWICFPSVYIL